VVGDGRVIPFAELVDIVNQDPRRGIGHEKVMTRLELDAQAEMMLARQGLNADSKIPADQVVSCEARPICPPAAPPRT